MKIHHIGYLVKNLESAVVLFRRLGYLQMSNIVRDDCRKIDIVFLQMDGLTVELVSPYDPLSVVGGLAKRIGNSPYHICYQTGSFNADVETLRNMHYVLCGEPAPAPACGGKRVAFLVHPIIGMIELLEL